MFFFPCPRMKGYVSSQKRARNCRLLSCHLKVRFSSKLSCIMGTVSFLPIRVRELVPIFYFHYKLKRTHFCIHHRLGLEAIFWWTAPLPKRYSVCANGSTRLKLGIPISNFAHHSTERTTKIK